MKAEKNAANLRTTNGFKPGYIFKNRSHPYDLSASLEGIIRVETARNAFIQELNADYIETEKIGYHGWMISHTPLEDYCADRFGGCKSPRLNFETFMEMKILGLDRKPNVLDIGVTYGEGWANSTLLDKINFECTNLALNDGIANPLKGRVKESDSASLHLHFPKDHFDVVVCHYGVKYQLPELIENAVYVSRKGANIFLSDEIPVAKVPCMSDSDQYAMIEMCSFETPFYKVVGYDAPISDSSRGWFLWLEKK